MTEPKETDKEEKKPESPKREGVFLETQQAQQVVNYLQEQPYSQVAVLIQHLLRAPKVTV